MKLISWNVNGVRAVSKKGFREWLIKESPDILCLQETKASEYQLENAIKLIPGYESYWCIGKRPGYSGVAVYMKVKPLSVNYGFGMDESFDNEGRILISELQDFNLLNIYFPNGQKDDERLRYKLAFYDATLKYCESLRKKGRELVICGDYNTAHNEIDLARPKDNENVSGFLRIERDWMDKFEAHGYIDTFRKMNPDKAGVYSWWSVRTAARERNVGWRLDYFYVSPGLWKRVIKAGIMSDVTGSDHCPVLLEIE
ncbi:MAG: exodeoxyribonuclease III [Lentisphaerae bacterium GWF2_44_16]|nr:MAG: exodeoxyribonuclease III [Lentisphaerae bacterium GWF2_44_16]